MRAIIQRVTSASVSVGGQRISAVGPGLCVLVGISRGDTEKDAEYICRKLLNMKLWDDPKSGKPWQQSVVRLCLCLCLCLCLALWLSSAKARLSAARLRLGVAEALACGSARR